MASAALGPVASNIPLRPGLGARRRPGLRRAHHARLRRRPADPRPAAPDDRRLAAGRAAARRGRRPDRRACCCSTWCSGSGATADPAAELGRAVRAATDAGVPVVVVGGRHPRRPAGPARPGRGAARAPAPGCSCPTRPPPGAPLDLLAAEARMSLLTTRRPSSPPAPRCSPTPCAQQAVDVSAVALAAAAPATPTLAGRGDGRPAPGRRQRRGAGRRCSAAQAHLVDVRPASEALGLERGQFLHAGPPVELGAGVRADARRADRRDAVRGAGRHRRRRPSGCSPPATG